MPVYFYNCFVVVVVVVPECIRPVLLGYCGPFFVNFHLGDFAGDFRVFQVSTLIASAFYFLLQGTEINGKLQEFGEGWSVNHKINATLGVMR